MTTPPIATRWRPRAKAMLERLHKLEVSTRRITMALAAAMAAAVWLLLSSGAAYAGCSQRVYVYSADWCGTCRRLRSYLDLNRIHYTLLDADDPRVKADMRRRFGSLAVPRTLIGRSVVSGLDTAKIEKLCR